jgi:hypothetical protein
VIRKPGWKLARLIPKSDDDAEQAGLSGRQKEEMNEL